MNGLADLQQRFQNDILKRQGQLLPSIRVPEGASPEKRLGVYQDAYKLRLVSILEEEYPALKQFMGETEFWRMADRFIDANPSAHPNARTVPTRLPDFMASDTRYRRHRPENEIAALENAFSCAFDAPDTGMAEMNDLATLPAESIGDMRIAFSPSVRLVLVTTNAPEIVEALKSAAPLPDAHDLDTPFNMLVWRQDLGTKYRPLAEEEFMLVNEAMAGKSFAELCRLAAVMDDPDTAAARMAGYLTQWINSGMVAALSVDGPA